MTPWQWTAAIGVCMLVVALAIWIVTTDAPTGDADHVSQAWRDEHSRERRD